MIRLLSGADLVMKRFGILLPELYDILFRSFGPQGWWPGESPLEIALGAILTQNTNWLNVAQVLETFKALGILEARILHQMPDQELAQRLRPVGYYNVKTRRVKNFLAVLAGQFDYCLDTMGQESLEQLRPLLLNIKGIGPETADSILLYAFHKPSFVVDAYTFRILNRHGLLPETCSYEELRQLFMDHLPTEVTLYQEYHALLVRLGKDFCRPQPRCTPCPLALWLEKSG